MVTAKHLIVYANPIHFGDPYVECSCGWSACQEAGETRSREIVVRSILDRWLHHAAGTSQYEPADVGLDHDLDAGAKYDQRRAEQCRENAKAAESDTEATAFISLAEVFEQRVAESVLAKKTRRQVD